MKLMTINPVNCSIGTMYLRVPFSLKKKKKAGILTFRDRKTASPSPPIPVRNINLNPRRNNNARINCIYFDSRHTWKNYTDPRAKTLFVLLLVLFSTAIRGFFGAVIKKKDTSERKHRRFSIKPRDITRVD